ncbi:MAG: hypothetical protein ACRDHD_10220, partial [Candidatus Limnocylindria bacterium]
MSPKIVSEVLGHKEVAITLDRYSHALPTLHTKAMARLDALLGRRGAARTGGHKGSNKGSPGPAEANEGPDPSVDRAETDGGLKQSAQHVGQRFAWFHPAEGLSRS